MNKTTKGERVFEISSKLKKCKVKKDIARKFKSQYHSGHHKSFALDILSLNEAKVGLHASIKIPLFCSRVLGLLPLSGLTSHTSDKLRFTLLSPYTVYFGVSMFGQVFMALTSCKYLIENDFSLTNVTNAVFNTSGLISSLVLINMARHWPLFTKRIEEIENKLPPYSRNVQKMATMTTAFLLIVGTVEHLLSVSYGCTVAYECDSNNVAETYFKYNFPWVFYYTSFSMWKALTSEFFNIQSAFVWSYNDLLIMIISIYLAEHFAIHSELLKKAVQKDYFVCNEFRTQYLKLVALVKLVNDHFGIYLVTCITGNLYWICTQLFYVLNKTQTGHFISCKLLEFEDSSSWFHEVHHSVYFVYSFSYLVIRASLVLLLAAKVHSNAQVPVAILNALPSSKYTLEVQRYLSQIKNMKTAMSGLDFFYVTRTMILTLVGTIVTYELVLLQLNKKT